MDHEQSSRKRKPEAGERQQDGKRYKKDSRASKYRSQAAQSSGRAVISASGLQSGDVGIFVTSDIGKEKNALRELEDLLSDFLSVGEHDGEGATGEAAIESSNTAETGEREGPRGTTTTTITTTTTTTADRELDIEADIQSELNDLKTDTTNPKTRRKGELDSISTTTGSRLGLITLDVPCVSFVRFPAPPPPSDSTSSPSTPSPPLPDPVDIVLRLLRSAHSSSGPSQQRSRFIKRLTPITRIRKVLPNGLDQLCDDVLPAHFGHHADDDEEYEKGNGGEGKARSWKYAVRANVRNNNQVGSSMDVVKAVAAKVAAFGEHKVDLKGYEKLVLVDVYRNVVGMSVLEVGGAEEWEGQLRKGNLGEVWGEARKEKVDEGEVRKEGEVQAGEAKKSRKEAHLKEEVEGLGDGN